MSIAQHVHLMAKTYEVQVVLHSDCCSQESLDWFQGMLDVDEANFKVNLIEIGVSNLGNSKGFIPSRNLIIL